MGKIGRPPAENPKRVRVEIRMSDDELEKLDFCCKLTGISRSDFLRRAILHRYRKLSGAQRPEKR